MVILTAIRIAVDALMARLVVGRRSGRWLRVFAATLCADCIIVVAGALLAGWVDDLTAGPGRRRMAMALGAAAVFVMAMAVAWEAALRWAARPLVLSRRRVGGAAATLLATWFGAVAVYAVVQQLVDPPPVITRGEVPVTGLPRAFDGLRVCVVGDLHVHRDRRRAALRRRLAALHTLRPDLIVLVGDYATAKPRYERDAAAVLGEQRAPLGVYAVLGNHEQFIGEGMALSALRGAGITVLVNQSVALKRGDATLYLAGVNDPYTARDDLAAALAPAPRGACVILAAHSPDIIDQAHARNVALVLAGHTHGGQIDLPLLGPPIVRSRYGGKYAHGRFREGRTSMFVTRGVGEILPYLRLNCPREIALLTLRSS